VLHVVAPVVSRQALCDHTCISVGFGRSISFTMKSAVYRLRGLWASK
jgi:hypothetical protein